MGSAPRARLAVQELPDREREREVGRALATLVGWRFGGVAVAGLDEVSALRQKARWVDRTGASAHNQSGTQTGVIQGSVSAPRSGASLGDPGLCFCKLF